MSKANDILSQFNEADFDDADMKLLKNKISWQDEDESQAYEDDSELSADDFWSRAELIAKNIDNQKHVVINRVNKLLRAIHVHDRQMASLAITDLRNESQLLIKEADEW